MAVFFVHEPGRGIVTPLDRRFRVRDIEPADEVTQTSRIHPREERRIDEATDWATPIQKREDDNVPSKDSKAAVRLEAKRAYQETSAETRLKLGKVGAFMSRNVLTVQESDSLAAAWDIMARYKIHHLAIVNAQSWLCGLLSEQAIAPYFMENPATDPEHVPMSEFCDETMLSTGTETDIVDLTELMLEYGLDGMPVTDNGRLVGIITNADILKVVLHSKHFDFNA